jgi:hypothetical protein
MDEEMGMKNRMILFALALGVLALGWTYLPRAFEVRAETPAVQKESKRAELRALEAEVAELRAETQHNVRTMNALRAQTVSDATAAAASAASATRGIEAEVRAEDGTRPGPDSEEYRAWEAERQAMIADTEASFQLEPRDSEWSRRITADIQAAALKHGSAKDVLRAIDCRSTTCRLEVVDDREKAEDLQKFLMDCSMIFPKMVADHIEGPNQQFSYIMYLKREA